MCFLFQTAPASIVLSPLTSLLCDVLKLTDPMATILERNAGAPSLDSSSRSRQDSAQCDSSVNTKFNPEEISLGDSDDDSSTAATRETEATQDETESSTSASNEPDSLASKLAAIRPKTDVTIPTETHDAAETSDALEESEQDSTESSAAPQNVVREATERRASFTG